MTIFKKVFQKHLDEQDPGVAAVDLLVDPPKHLKDEAVPDPSKTVRSVELPTGRTHDLPPPMEDAKAAPQGDAPQPIPEPPKELDPDLVARAAEAHRMIQQSQTRREEPAASTPPATSAAPEQAAPQSSGRTRTRLLGFGGDAASTLVDPLTDLQETPAQAQFPCGWLVVTKGPGRGASFALHAGMATIGRGEDQSIPLNFGDRAISREKHAVVAYDSETGKFFLGHGGKSNIIRLNDRPVLSTEEISHGDTVRIGETVLRFAAFCDQSFNWSEEEG